MDGGVPCGWVSVHTTKSCMTTERFLVTKAIKAFEARNAVHSSTHCADGLGVV